MVLAVLVAPAFADRPIKQVRPQYVEWGDPDYPHARQRDNVSSGTLYDSEGGDARAGGAAISVSVPLVEMRHVRCASNTERYSRSLQLGIDKASKCPRWQAKGK